MVNILITSSNGFSKLMANTYFRNVFKNNEDHFVSTGLPVRLVWEEINYLVVNF